MMNDGAPNSFENTPPTPNSFENTHLANLAVHENHSVINQLLVVATSIVALPAIDTGLSVGGALVLFIGDGMATK